MSDTRQAPDIPALLAAARRDAEGLRAELAHAEQEMQQALERQDFKAADKAKAKADAVRPHVMVAEGHVTALQQAADALEDHRRQEQEATEQRARREQAQGLMEAAQRREAEALEEMQRMLAEIKPAILAVRHLYQAALAAQDAATQARVDAHHTGITAGHIDPTVAVPVGPNQASVLPDWMPALREILRADL